MVVGVFDDERQVSVAQSSRPEIEVSIPQIRPDTGFYFGAEGFVMDLAVRTERSPALMIPELRELMRSASPELSTSTFTTMDQIVEDSYPFPRNDPLGRRRPWAASRPWNLRR